MPEYPNAFSQYSAIRISSSLSFRTSFEPPDVLRHCDNPLVIEIEKAGDAASLRGNGLFLRLEGLDGLLDPWGLLQPGFQGVERPVRATTFRCSVSRADFLASSSASVSVIPGKDGRRLSRSGPRISASAQRNSSISLVDASMIPARSSGGSPSRIRGSIVPTRASAFSSTTFGAMPSFWSPAINPVIFARFSANSTDFPRTSEIPSPDPPGGRWYP